MCCRSRFQRILPLALSSADDVLHVDAVALHDQQVFPDHRRAARSVLVVVFELLRLPDQLTFGREAGRAVCAEMNVDPTVLDHWGRRGVTVVGMNRSGLVEMKHLDVVERFARIAGQRNRPQRVALVDGAGEPDLIADHGRRRPAQAGNRNLPGDVLGFAPSERHVARGGMSLAIRSAKLRPIVGDCCSCLCKKPND